MQARVRPVAYHAPAVDVERRADGTTIVRPREPVGDYPARLTERLEHFAATTPDTVLLGQRDASGAWRTVTYAQALRAVRSLGQSLLGRGLSPERPVAILSGNDIEHALLGLACLHVGIPYAPLSTAYSLLATDFAKLRMIFDRLTPGLVFAADGGPYGRAIAAVAPADATVVVTANPPAGRPAELLGDWLATEPTQAVDEAAAAVGPETIGKLLFTSGTTGVPKGVITTHRMMCANLAMQRQVFAVVQQEPPVLVDWLPWSHVFGGTHNFGMALFNGGSFYIDEGRPVPGKFDATIRNLRDISPTAYLTVPKGWEELAAALREDAALRANFFRRARIFFYAAASLTQHVWDEIDRLAEETVGERIMMVTGLGCTETAPLMMVTRADLRGAGLIGLPAPGTELKLAPAGDKLEVRTRGPNVTPGYWREPALTERAFDEDGFYRMGDAVAWVDAADPQKGFRFDGRITEDFKLATGTWVDVSRLKDTILRALHPQVTDVVITGHDRDYVGALAIPASPALAADREARREIAVRLDKLAHGGAGSSMRVLRLAFLTDPLSLDAGEITDKGSINQRQVLRSRAALVDALYSDPPPASVLVVGEDLR